MARPQAVLSVPKSRTSIILTLDVSRSMCSTDVQPNRLSAAQAAARKFVDEQPGGTRLGIVAFAGSAQIIVPPTTDADKLKEAIDSLTTGVGTVIGNGLLTSIDALSHVNSDIAPSTVKLNADERKRSRFDSRYVPDIVVLLTDGAATGGVDPLEAAQQAADRRVHVYTIGFGTTNPDFNLVCTAEQLGADIGDSRFGGGGGFRPDFGGGGPPGGFGRFLDIDEKTLPRHRQDDRWHLQPGGELGAAGEGLPEPAQARRHADGEARAQRLPRAPRRAPRHGRGRPRPLVEPLPVTAGHRS